MKAFLQLAAALALLSVGTGAAVLTYDAHRLARRVDQSMTTLDTQLKVQSLNLAQDEMHLDAVLSEVEKAAIEQRAYWQKTSADSDKTVKALRVAVDRASLLLDHTDKQLNGALLPDADREMVLTAQAAQSSLASFGRTSDTLAFQVNELNVGPAMANLSESSARLANTMGNLQGASLHANNILAAGDRTAVYYEKKLTTPASFARKLAEALLDVGAKLGSIFAGFVK